MTVMIVTGTMIATIHAMIVVSFNFTLAIINIMILFISSSLF